MARIKVIHDPVGETLTVYWGEPSPNQISEEMGEGVILIKNPSTQEVIGFERLYFHPQVKENSITLESVEAA